MTRIGRPRDHYAKKRENADHTEARLKLPLLLKLVNECVPLSRMGSSDKGHYSVVIHGKDRYKKLDEMELHGRIHTGIESEMSIGVETKKVA